MRCYYIQLTKNKGFEFQIGQWEHWSYIDIELEWSRRRDHAGFRLDMQLFGFYFIISICDNRHWDVKNNKWET